MSKIIYRFVGSSVFQHKNGLTAKNLNPPQRLGCFSQFKQERAHYTRPLSTPNEAPDTNIFYMRI